MQIRVAYKFFLVCGLTLVLTTISLSVKAQGVDSYVLRMTPLATDAESEVEVESVAKADTTIVTTTKRATKFAIKTNLAQWAALTSNIGLEIPIRDHFSVDLPLTYSPYTVNDDWKLRLLVLQPEVRYWFSDSCLRGHFLGIHAQAGYFNVAINSPSRYQNCDEEPMWGAGLSYGYALKITNGLNVEFNIGAGYANLRYDIFYNIDNGAKFDYDTREYWGITRAAISITYIINHNK